MKDYFEIRKKFLRNKNIDIAFRIEEDFTKALNGKKLCSVLLDDSNKLDKFKNKMSNLFHRINSLGFALKQMKSEEKDWENFIETAYHPDRVPGDIVIGWVVGAEEPITLEFAFESFLFFVDATFEYLSQSIGIIFKNPGVKELTKLKNILQKNYADNKLAQKIIEILENGKPLWAEIQEKGVREFFEDVEPYIDKYEGKSLRDIVGHYRAIKISPIQMAVSRKGSDPGRTLKAGSWKVKPGEKARFGDLSAGLVHKTEDYIESLVNWIKSILELIYGEKSTTF